MIYNSKQLKVPYDKILEETRLKLAISKEHLSKLQTFGMTQQWLNELQNKADEAEKIVTQSQQLEEMKSLTAAKNEALDACVDWATKLRFRMELIFKGKQPKGMQFPNKEFNNNRKNESKMITLMPSLIAMAKEHEIALKTVGQTPQILQEGETVLNQLKTANEAQEQYKLTRTTVTAQRRKVFKELYEGVNYINRMGQMTYNNESAEKLQFRSNWTSGTHSSYTETVQEVQEAIVSH